MADFVLRKAEREDVADILRLIKVPEPKEVLLDQTPHSLPPVKLQCAARACMYVRVCTCTVQYWSLIPSD